MHTSNVVMLLVGAVRDALVVRLGVALAGRTRGILACGLIVTALCYVYSALQSRTGPAWS